LAGIFVQPVLQSGVAQQLDLNQYPDLQGIVELPISETLALRMVLGMVVTICLHHLVGFFQPWLNVTLPTQSNKKVAKKSVPLTISDLLVESPHINWSEYIGTNSSPLNPLGHFNVI